MKKILTLLLFYATFSFAQINGGSVQYSLIFQDDKELDSDDVIGGYYKDAKENAKYVSLSLDFNENEMLFYANNTMNADGHKTTFALAFGNVVGIFYKTKEMNVLYTEIEQPDLGDLIIKSDINIKWELTNETKMIANYLCYKATAIKTVDNGAAGIFKEPITAWYAPKLPIPFGPNEFGGLPGLILELHERNVVYGATKIVIDTNEKTIKKPTKGKEITEKEFHKMIEDNMQKQ